MISSKKQSKIDYDKSIGKETEHIPNKDESKLLRSLMGKNGLTKDEVLSIKKYRDLLSKEQKAGQKSDLHSYGRIVRKITKSITKDLKLAKEHPMVVKELKLRLGAYRKCHWMR